MLTHTAIHHMILGSIIRHFLYQMHGNERLVVVALVLFVCWATFRGTKRSARRGTVRYVAYSTARVGINTLVRKFL